MAGVVFRFISNLFYYIAEGIPKTILPILLPAFFYLRGTVFMPVLLLVGLGIFFFFGKTLWKNKTSLFGLYVIAYVLFFAVQPALDDVTFVDRYMLALLPFLLIFAAEILGKDFFAKMRLAKPVFVFIILVGAILSIGYAITLEQRMQNEKYLGLKEAVLYISENVGDEEIVVFEAPMHLYLNSGNKAVPTPEIGRKAGARYAIIDGFMSYEESDFNGFRKVFTSGNGTAAVYRKN